jgi:hypothetical protein
MAGGSARGNEPAFPVQGGPFEGMLPGLTKREWFAGMAMMGFLQYVGFNAGWLEINKIREEAIQAATKMAFAIADAMIAVAEK